MTVRHTVRWLSPLSLQWPGPASPVVRGRLAALTALVSAMTWTMRSAAAERLLL